MEAVPVLNNAVTEAIDQQEHLLAIAAAAMVKLGDRSRVEDVMELARSAADTNLYFIADSFDEFLENLNDG